jgi:hypothetical protein
MDDEIDKQPKSLPLGFSLPIKKGRPITGLPFIKAFGA